MSEQKMTRLQPLTVRANFAWNFAGKLVYAASRALILTMIAKLGSAEMVGQYALAFAVTTPVFMLADLDLRSVLATDTKNGIDFGHYLGLRLVTTLLAITAVCVLAPLQSGAGNACTILLLVGAAKSVEAMSDMLFGLLQKHERLNRLGISLMIKGGLSLLAMGLGLGLKHSLAWGAAALAISWLAVLALYDIPAVRPYARIRIRLSPRALWALARLSLPLGAVLLFASLSKNLSNYFIEAFHGAASLGYFSSIVYIMSTGSLVASALSQSVNARLAKLFSAGDTRGFIRTFARNAALTAAMGACMLLAAAAFGRQILTLLYRPEYAAWQGVFVVVMGAAGVSYAAEIAASALTATRRFKVQPFLSLGVLLAGLALNYLLVPGYGLMGAAACIAMMSCLQLAGNLSVLASAIRKRKAASVRQAAENASGSDSVLTVERVAFADATAEDFAAEWKALLSKNGGGTAFAYPDWLAAWTDAFGAGREPLILAVREKGALAAVFPLMLQNGRVTRRIAFLGHPQATHMDIACRSGLHDRAAGAALAYLRSMRGAIEIELSGICDGSALSMAVGSELRTEHCQMFAGRTPSPILHAGGQDYDKFCRKRFSQHAMKNNKRDEKRLAALGAVVIREMGGCDMAAAFALHDLRWQRKLDTSGFTGARSREFFTGLLNAGQGPWKALALGLYLDKRLIAFQYGFVCGSRALLYKSAHDGLFDLYAPGKMIKREYVRRCLAKGVACIDFGVGYEEYKAEWTDERESILSFSFPNQNALSTALFPLLKLKAALRAHMKQSRRIVLFKRNTLGNLRFRLSSANLAAAGKRLLSPAGYSSLHGRLTRMLPAGRPVALLLQQGEKGTPAVKFPAEKATPADVPTLASLAGCDPQEIMRRLYRLQRCNVIRRGGSIACAAWVSEQDGKAEISGFCRDAKLCREQDVVQLLHSIAAAHGHTATTLIAGRRDAALLSTAEALGFVRADGEEGSRNQANDRKGLIPIANPDHP